jgi:hypothetical protein
VAFKLYCSEGHPCMFHESLLKCLIGEKQWICSEIVGTHKIFLIFSIEKCRRREDGYKIFQF